MNAISAKLDGLFHFFYRSGVFVNSVFLIAEFVSLLPQGMEMDGLGLKIRLRIFLFIKVLLDATSRDHRESLILGMIE